MDKHTGFLGTYFDRDSVLKLEFWSRVAAWVVLVLYLYNVGYSVIQTLYNAFIGGFSPDWWYLGSLVTPLAQGLVLFILMQVAAKCMLILLDIEDNTRRSARLNKKLGA